MAKSNKMSNKMPSIVGKQPPNFKGSKNPVVKGAKGDNSSKQLPMKSADSVGRGKVKAAREARLVKAGY